jgi:hypothetical protein
MWLDPGCQELMSAEPEGLAHRRVERAEVTVAADAKDGVIAALSAQRAVAELGGQRGVPPGEPALRDELRQQQVGVSVATFDCKQDVERDPPGRIPDVLPGGIATTGATTTGRGRRPGSPVAAA